MQVGRPAGARYGRHGSSMSKFSLPCVMNMSVVCLAFDVCPRLSPRDVKHLGDVVLSHVCCVGSGLGAGIPYNIC